jgi:hypothetical protein
MTTTAEDVWQILAELAMAQRQTDQQLKETDQQLKETDRKILSKIWWPLPVKLSF